MLAVTLVCNLMIGLLCCYSAWRLWRLKCRLAKAADTLLACDRAVHRVLDRAPDAIYRGHAGIHQLRERYQGLEPQLQRAQQALALLSLGQTLWQRRAFVLTRRSPRRAP
jgi:hypothetical protein